MSRSNRTDGIHRFWPDFTSGVRWRWARIHWLDDGIGVPTHGAENTLSRAREAAKRAEAVRVAAVQECPP